MNPRYFLLVLCVGLLLVGTASAWYDTDWNYRKEVTINNTGSNLTNYQIAFTVNRSAGTDSGSTVFLNSKCESDYDDIRFIGADDTTAWDYWIESSSSTVATIWVEVPSIPNSTAYGSTTGYLYYGNSGAAAVSNGTNTFPFFDDFPGSSLDSSKWNNIAGSGVAVSSGICTITAGGASVYGISTKSTRAPPFVLECSVKPTHVTQGQIEGVQTKYVDDNNQAAVYFCFIDSPSNNKYRTQKGVTTNVNDIDGDAAGEYNRVTSWLLDSSVKYQCKSTTGGVGSVITHTTGYPSGSGYERYLTYGSGAVMYVDWALIRQYAATEPTVSDWGEEEEQLIVVLYPSFSALPTSGYVPLLVSFSDSSTADNATINTWQWSFGDSSANSTQQNPQHQYITSGLYDVILTITNTSFSLTNSTIKTGYINVTVNADAPNADFTVMEICGDVGDTFYFIDFSTGGGLYAWNWSFGDGAYSELRNPTHQYAANGTYDVNLTVWGAYGIDSLLRSNLITIPCGAPTPTPTPTPTATTTTTPTGNATVPVQAPAQPGRISPLGFVLLAGMNFGLLFYAFIDNENRNYFHIVALIAGMVVAFLCGTFLITGYITEDFVVTNLEASVNESVLSTYSVHQAQIIDAGFGYFFIFIGVIMLILGIMAAVEAIREFSTEAGDFE